MDDGSADFTIDDAEEQARYGHLRAAPRDSMLLMATLRGASGQYQVKIRNLSAGGMMAECEAGILRGDAITVDLRGIGWVSGRVAWSTKGRFGVAFDEAIDPKLARKPVAATPQPQLVKTLKTMWRPGVGVR